jgi:hypothetical protein
MKKEKLSLNKVLAGYTVHFDWADEETQKLTITDDGNFFTFSELINLSKGLGTKDIHLNYNEKKQITEVVVFLNV